MRLNEHLSRAQCQEIGRDLQAFLDSERAGYHRLKGNDAKVLQTAINIIQQRALISSPAMYGQKIATVLILTANAAPSTVTNKFPLVRSRV